MKTKIESPFIKIALLVLEEGEYETKMTNAKFEELKHCIATSVKTFYLLGKKQFEIDDCKAFLADFGEGDALDDILEKAMGDEVKE